MKSFFALLALPLISCTQHYGNATILKEENLQRIQNPPHTPPQVFDVLGQPSEVQTLGEGKTRWVYRYRAAKPDLMNYMPLFGISLFLGGTNGTLHTKTLDFNAQNKVSQVQSLPSEDIYTYNLFNTGRSLSNPFLTSPKQDEVKKELERWQRPFDASKAKEHQILHRALGTE